MSIARDEAEEYAQRRYVGMVHIERREGRADVVPDFPLQIVYRREGYLAGRQADITDAEIDAVATIDCADATNGCCEFADESDADKRLWRNHARTLLEAARKAVTK
jgi:hypothetical protein